jgi:hypothetical protein
MSEGRSVRSEKISSGVTSSMSPPVKKPSVFSEVNKIVNPLPPRPGPIQPTKPVGEVVTKPKPAYIPPARPVAPTPSPAPAPKVVRDNPALKEILNKALDENKVFELKKEEVKKEEPVAVVPPAPEPISLDSLKNKPSETIAPSKDKSASTENMNKLKDLISNSTPTPPPAPAPVAPSQPPTPEKTGTQPPLTAGNIPEVPEDVLRKILE